MNEEFPTTTAEWRWRIALLKELEGVREALQRLEKPPKKKPKEEPVKPAEPRAVGRKGSRRKKEVKEDGNLGES